MWQKQQQVGTHRACVPYVNLFESNEKFEREASESAERKLQSSIN